MRRRRSIKQTERESAERLTLREIIVTALVLLALAALISLAFDALGRLGA